MLSSSFSLSTSTYLPSYIYMHIYIYIYMYIYMCVHICEFLFAAVYAPCCRASTSTCILLAAMCPPPHVYIGEFLLAAVYPPPHTFPRMHVCVYIYILFIYTPHTLPHTLPHALAHALPHASLQMNKSLSLIRRIRWRIRLLRAKDES